MKKKITRDRYRKLHLIVPNPGSGHIKEAIAHLGYIWGGYHTPDYQSRGIRDVHCAIAYLQRYPPQLDEAEVIIRQLRKNFGQSGDLSRSFDTILLRLDGYRLKHDLFEVVDDETCPGR